MQSPESSAISVTRGRWYVCMAALLWSTSGAFTKLLTEDTGFGFNEPTVATFPLAGYQVPVIIACYRTLFAGAVLMPAMKLSDIRFRGVLFLSALAFTIMNATFITAMALGTSANAILLQYSAPVWVYVASVFFLGEKTDRRGTITMMLGMVGIGVIMAGGSREGNLGVVLIGLTSGMGYGAVLVCIRHLRELSSAWITVWNHLCSALVLLPMVLMLPQPSPKQFVLLFFYGSLQMGLAYYLVARGLRAIGPQEAGTISLLEPLLNPVWAFLVSPATETPGLFTYIGGSVILFALAWRYWPRRGMQLAKAAK